MLGYCPGCKRMVEHADGKCTRCGARARGVPPSDHFVSGIDSQGGQTPELTPGAVLERFTIARRIGGLNGTAVYLARDTVRGEDVALKVGMAIDAGPPDAAAQQLQREMSLHGRIADHRHVVRVHDLHCVPAGGLHWLVLSMECADGGTLRDWLVAHREDVHARRDEGLAYFKEACAGLAAMHEAGLVHLDVKPENLAFVGGVLKVLDLGASMATQSGELYSGVAAQQLPACPGTKEYASPQHLMAARLDELDQRADIYSLGVILYETLDQQGRLPFTGSFERLRELHLRVSPPPLVGVDTHLTRIVTRCLQKDPDGRYDDIGELLDDLEGRRSRTPGESSALDERWRDVRQLVTTGRLNAALRACREILAECPQHAEASATLEDLQARYREAKRLYAAVEQDLDQRGLNELAGLVQAAVRVYPQHPAGLLIQARLATRAREYREQIRAGVDALQRGYWETALTCLERARRMCPDTPRLAQAVEFVTQVLHHRATVRGHVDQAIRAGQKGRALALARALDEYLGDVHVEVRRS